MSAGVLQNRRQGDVAMEAEVQSIGKRLNACRGRWRPFRAAQDRAAAPLLDDPRLREALFRIVDAAPACQRPAELAEHFDAVLADDAYAPTRPMALASMVANRPVSQPLVGRVLRRSVRTIADRFIVGESVEAAADVLGQLWREGAATSVDLLGESSVSHSEADGYALRCGEALSTLATAAGSWARQDVLEQDAAGSIPRVNLSVKPTALTPQIRAEAPLDARSDLGMRLRRLLQLARDSGAHLHVDMEALDTRESTLAVVLELLKESEFADGPSVGLVVQAYLRDSDAILTRIIDRVRSLGRASPLTIRLVKGAYWDHETIHALQRGWSPPVWRHKYESDRCFERLTRRLIDGYPDVRPAIASHNLRSIAYAIAYARSRGLDDHDLEVQVLRGLGDDLQDSLAANGYRVRTYCPVGDLVAGMGYLVRRLLENSSNESFLVNRKNGIAVDELLRAP